MRDIAFASSILPAYKTFSRFKYFFCSSILLTVGCRIIDIGGRSNFGYNNLLIAYHKSLLCYTFDCDSTLQPDKSEKYIIIVACGYDSNNYNYERNNWILDVYYNTSSPKYRQRFFFALRWRITIICNKKHLLLYSFNSSVDCEKIA